MAGVQRQVFESAAAGTALTHLTFLGMPASQGLTTLLGFMAGVMPDTPAVASLTVAVNTAGVGVAVAGGAGLGLLFGSAANCASQGVAP
jgi:hypothetical protein